MPGGHDYLSSGRKALSIQNYRALRGEKKRTPETRIVVEIGKRDRVIAGTPTNDRQPFIWVYSLVNPQISWFKKLSVVYIRIIIAFSKKLLLAELKNKYFLMHMLL